MDKINMWVTLQGNLTINGFKVGLEIMERRTSEYAVIDRI